jgi:CheY-like chemotaxis protein
MDGPTTLSHLRKNPHTSDIPVLFLTVRTEPLVVDRLIALGAKGVIPKPFEPTMLGPTLLSYLVALGRA